MLIPLPSVLWSTLTDIKLHRCICSPEDCLILQNNIDILDWLKHWLLSFNVSNCKALHIDNAPYTGNYAFEGILLELLEPLNGSAHLKIWLHNLRLAHIKD